MRFDALGEMGEVSAGNDSLSVTLLIYHAAVCSPLTGDEVKNIRVSSSRMQNVVL